MPAAETRGRAFRKRWRRQVLRWLAVEFFGRLLLPLLVRSWRIETDFPDQWLHRARQGDWLIVAFWHNRQLALIRVAATLDPVTALVSRHGDGEIIARIATRLNVRTIRGSSTRGGRAALKQMIAACHETNVAITPDGPIGPRYEVKPGVIKLAAVTGRPLFWVSWSSDRAWIFKSWDRMILPKPFARIHFRADGPITLAADLGSEELEAARLDLEARMRAQTADLDGRMEQEIDPILTH